MAEQSSTRSARRRWVAALTGVALILLAIVLAPRPLSALVVVVWVLAAMLAAWACTLLAASRRRIGVKASAVALFAASVAIIWFLPAVVGALSVSLIIALGIGALRMFVLAFRPATAGQRTTRVLGAVALAGFALLTWWWPDAALIAIALCATIAAGIVGVVLVYRAVRGARPPKTRRTRRDRPVLRWTGTLAAVALVAALVAGSAFIREGAPASGDFYAWNDPIPAAGTLLRTEAYTGEVPVGARAYRILYATTYSDGTPALASGLVALPTAKASAPRLVLAWQHGTTGVAQGCAPSLSDNGLSEYAIPGIGTAIERGWDVVATDYPGQGTAGRYPYLIGQGEGRATLDGVRALAHISDAHASNRVMLWGHSQGGHATLWAGQIAPTYAPDLTVVSVAALSAAWDPLSMARGVTAKRASALTDVATTYVLVPYVDEYADIAFAHNVHPAGHSIARAFASRCATQLSTLVTALVAWAIGADAPLYRIDVDTEPMHARLSQNVASGIVPAPLFLGQGTDDEVVPIALQRTLARALCSKDRAVSVHEYAGRTHMGVVAADSPLIPDLYSWADEVIAGKTPPSTCG